MTTCFRYSSRLNSFNSRPDLFAWQYQPSDVRDLIRRVGQVGRLDSLDLNYPEHFDHVSVDQIESAIKATHLKLNGINMRYPEREFYYGAFTNPDPEKRRSAIRLTQKAADVCRQMGGSHLVLWLGYDGFDYPFQLDYAQAWEWEIAGIQEVADYAKDLKVSIEYKLADPRRFSLLGNLGITLQAINECQRPNLGVTLDFCHLLMADENPAMSAALSARLGKLFGIHLNDGFGSFDDGLMVGSINFFQTLELFYYITQSNYCDVIYFDTFPNHEDPVKECLNNIQRVDQFVEIVDQLKRRNIQVPISQQDGLQVSQLVWEASVCQLANIA